MRRRRRVRRVGDDTQVPRLDRRVRGEMAPHAHEGRGSDARVPVHTRRGGRGGGTTRARGNISSVAIKRNGLHVQRSALSVFVLKNRGLPSVLNPSNKGYKCALKKCGFGKKTTKKIKVSKKVKKKDAKSPGRSRPHFIYLCLALRSRMPTKPGSKTFYETLVAHIVPNNKTG